MKLKAPDHKGIKHDGRSVKPGEEIEVSRKQDAEALEKAGWEPVKTKSKPKTTTKKKGGDA